MTETTPSEPPKTVPERKSSGWLGGFAFPSNLTNQFTNISSTFAQATTKVGTAANTLAQATSKMGTAANTFVQKSINERFFTSAEIEQANPEVNTTSKNFTSILTDLSSTVVKGAQQLKQAVEEKTLIGNFTKEQEKFLVDKRTQKRHEETAVPPWVGFEQEEEIKKQILELSKDERNFLRDPPPAANYHFNMTTMYPIALAILEVDEALRDMRFKLVPKQINEESFWHNYFYRVSLIKQATQLSALTNENTDSQSTDETRHMPKNRAPLASDSQENASDAYPDFVSEDFDTSALTMDDIRREIEQLSVPKSDSNKAKDLDDSEWDKSLADELENVTAEELEAQINELLSGNKK